MQELQEAEDQRRSNMSAYTVNATRSYAQLLLLTLFAKSFSVNIYWLKSLS